jgi:hypothetical protein
VGAITLAFLGIGVTPWLRQENASVPVFLKPLLKTTLRCLDSITNSTDNTVFIYSFVLIDLRSGLKIMGKSYFREQVDE